MGGMIFYSPVSSSYAAVDTRLLSLVDEEAPFQREAQLADSRLKRTRPSNKRGLRIAYYQCLDDNFCSSLYFLLGHFRSVERFTVDLPQRLPRRLNRQNVKPRPSRVSSGLRHTGSHDFLPYMFLRRTKDLHLAFVQH